MQKNSIVLPFSISNTQKILFLSVFFLSSFLAHAFPAKFAVGPDNNQTLALSTLLSAKKSLDINIYQLDHPTVVKTIIERIRAGVTVNLLVEAHPVGGINAAGKAALTQIKDAMVNQNKSARSTAQSHLYLMTAKYKNSRRYRFDHAKYILVDQKTALVSSENLTTGGHATPGYKGSRGWDILIEQKDFTAELAAIFKDDINSQEDILDLTYEDTSDSSSPVRQVKSHGSEEGISKIRIPDFELGQGDVKSAQLITSPHSDQGLVEMIQSARVSIDVEEMTLPSTWQVGADHKIIENPLVTALIEAARRGVQIRLLLNDDAVFGGGGGLVNSTTHDSLKGTSIPKNELTRQYFEKLKFCEHLPISAKVIDVEAAGITYIHNKGFVIDGKRALISSINGTQNSVSNNREVAVLVESPAAASYFRGVFEADWANGLRRNNPTFVCGHGLN
jgi:phosphatidylserine/phosphatidylglycerophosphate/cardiolipin synthase-like enzyme